jgi:hypothetical protein
MTVATGSPPDTSLAVPRALLGKSEVLLGRMSEEERQWTLALASYRLRVGEVYTEREANHRLQAALAEELAFLDLDHVELRRWLVDAGWWQRDGYGRAYQRVATPGLAPAQAEMRQALEALGDPAQWALQVRREADDARQNRRAAWAARRATTRTAATDTTPSTTPTAR